MVPKKKRPPLDPAVESLRRTILDLRDKEPLRSNGLDAQLERMIGMMPHFPDHFLYVYNYSEGRMVYHQGFTEVLGYPDHDVNLDLLYEILHPEDAPVVARLNEAVIRAMAQIRNPKNLFSLTLTVDYRIRRLNGAFMKVLRRTGVFEVDKPSGRVISTFSLCQDISAIKTSNHIGWQIRGLDKDKIDLSSLNPYMERMQYRPSVREMDILRELSKGNTSREAAEALNISPYTVDTHRRNLLRRTGLNSMVELARVARELGWV